MLILCFFFFYSFYVFLFWYQCQPRVLVQGSGKNCLILTLAGEISPLNQVSLCEMRHVDMSKGKSVGSCFTLAPWHHSAFLHCGKIHSCLGCCLYKGKRKERAVHTCLNYLNMLPDNLIIRHFKITVIEVVQF